MILLALKKYIKQHQQVSLKDIQYHFDIDEAAAIGLLEPLIKQGYVQALSTSNGCQSNRRDSGCHSGCQQVSKSAQFQWCDAPVKPLPITIQII